jgi:hypothetical protein
MWVFIVQKIKDWRSSFITACIFFGVYVWFLTEILSLFNLLTSSFILLGWLVCNVVLLLLIFRLYKTGRLQIKIPQVFPFQWEYGVFAIILTVTFFIAVAYPPNNSDSMVYHLPRVEHWLQNKNINHYFTSEDRQLISAPFNAMFILHGRALSGDDYLVNLPQWVSFLGAIIGISKIASHLGLNRKWQIAASLFFATVPMAILQAATTQNDLIIAFFIVCLTERLLAWKKNGTLFESLTFGLALGLSILTKGTAYSIAFPFVLCFAIISIKHFRNRFTGACLATVLCLVINLPHYTRNYMSFRNPIGAHYGTVSTFSFKSFAITLPLNVYSNIFLQVPSDRLNFPILEKVNKQFDRMWDALKVDETIFPFGRPKLQGIGIITAFHEDTVSNFLHMILVIISFVLLFPKNKRNLYSFLVIGSWCMFAWSIPWQPWITRLQLPLFALSAPVFAMAVTNITRCGKLSALFACFVISVSLSIFAIHPLFMNASRPLLHIPRINSYHTIWNTPRDGLIFINRYSDGSYVNASASVVQAGIQNLGILIDGDSWEYPLWRYIRKNSGENIRIAHVKEDTLESNIDALFVLNRQVSIVIPNEDNLERDSPLVLIRDVEKKHEWTVLYSTRLDN